MALKKGYTRIDSTNFYWVWGKELLRMYLTIIKKRRLKLIKRIEKEGLMWNI